MRPVLGRPLLVIAFVLTAGCLGGTPKLATDAPPAAGVSSGPTVVIAHIDTGINPYHADFRWNDSRAWIHPSQWLPGYPADAKALNLSLNATTYERALEADASVWSSIQRGQVYWIPGTKIVAAVSFGEGGRYCPVVPVPPANQLLEGDCLEHPILDDFGHGTMTASRMAGRSHSLNPDGLIVSLEAGDTFAALDFVEANPWIDVVSNSWGSLLPSALDEELARRVEEAAHHALFLFASGNGLGFINGVVGQPTYIEPTFMPSVLIVGAHDNGYTTVWHGAPPHVVADGYGGWRADPRHVTLVAPDPGSCCTSSSAPYASGGAAALILEARRLLGDHRTGLRGEGDSGVLAEGPAAGITQGPLADGKLTMAELKSVYVHTAQPRPGVTGYDSDDGLIHFTATPGATPSQPWLGDNPYCVACWTSPVPLRLVPPDVPLVYLIGYGAVNAASVDLGRQVLEGSLAPPARDVEDRFFEADATLRSLLQPHA
jgi:subtilase family protein